MKLMRGPGEDGAWLERVADAARYHRELEERYVAEAARARWMSSGGQSYGGYGGAYYSPPTEYGGYGRVREKTPPGRRPSGFKPMYTGAEVRRSDSPVYGWNQTAWPAPPREPLRPFGWTPSTGWSSAPAANAPAKVVIKKEKTKKLAAKKATTVATTAATVKPSTVPAPKKKKSTKNRDMYRPVDEDDDFEEAVPSKSAAASETPAILKPMADQVKALAQEVRSFVKEEKEWRNKVNNELCAPPHPHYAMQTMTATSYAATAAKERSRVPWYSYGR
ncbi:hypothetical protein PF004_g21149 [Phytophthora fragariae]|uniref:Uncharacterized protein n=1 Tax=Phytophthora fragariae TaxID=53985 RepID=A0A6G0N5Q9_9STRA|nr:hypothetical protein PF004_g21149 [Phytophthora fragariae]